MRLTIDPCHGMFFSQAPLSESSVQVLLAQSLLQACSVGSYLLPLKYCRATGKFKLLRRPWAASRGDCLTSDQCTAEQPASRWR